MADPWCPLLEANQGAISVAALAIALLAFFWELYRANTQHLRELEQEIEGAIILIEDLEDIVIDDGTERPLYSEDAHILATALRALAAAHVKKPTLSLPLLRVAQIADEIQSMPPQVRGGEAGDIADKLSDLKAMVEEALKESRRRVVFRRTERRKVRKAVDRLVKLRARQKPEP